MRNLTVQEKLLWEKYMSNLTTNPHLVVAYPDRRLSFTLDLHHCTIQQAFNKFHEFIYEHQSIGSSYVTVITGRSGKIQDEFPYWCKNIPSIQRIDPLDGDTEDAGSWRLFLKKHKIRQASIHH